MTCQMHFLLDLDIIDEIDTNQLKQYEINIDLILLYSTMINLIMI